MEIPTIAPVNVPLPTPPSPATPSKAVRFFSGLAVSVICSLGLTAILSAVTLRYTYGGPGIGFILFVPFALVASFAGNLLASMLLSLVFGRWLRPSRSIAILVGLNILVAMWYTVPLMRDYQNKKESSAATLQRYEREQYLGQHPGTIAGCDEIVENYYFWHGCVGLSRIGSPNAPRETSLAACLDQAQRKHFISQPQDPILSCTEYFSE